MNYQTLVPTALIIIALVLTCILLYKTLLERKGQQEPNPGIGGMPDSPPSGNHIFKNVRLIHENISVLIEEIRVLENGIFIIVSKNRSGDIVGSEEDEVWTQYKHDGTRREMTQKTLRNPLAMTRLHTFVLAKKLAEIGCNMWVQGVVVFTHPNAELNLKLKRNSNTAVLTGDRLENYIKEYQPRATIDFRQIEKIRDWLTSIQHTETVIQVRSMDEAYEATYSLANEFGYKVGPVGSDGSFHLTKNHQPYATVTITSDLYAISTYRAEETDVLQFLIAWLNRLGVCPPRNFTHHLETYIDQDAERRLEPQTLEINDRLVTYSGSMRYGVLKISVSASPL